MGGAPPKYVRSGATIPAMAAFQQHLNATTTVFAFGLPDSSMHAPNENFRYVDDRPVSALALDSFFGGFLESMYLFTSVLLCCLWPCCLPACCRLSMYRLAREAWVHFLFELGKQAAADSQQQAAADRSEL